MKLSNTHLSYQSDYQYSGTAVYRGVSLKKVLKIACGGILPECQHLEFIGADTYFKYGRLLYSAASSLM